MTLFILLLFLFSIFFTFDNKPINLLLDFIGIILSLSFFLILSVNSVDLSFFSFIFIIIYGSALAILFAFILMLFSDNILNKDNLSLPSNPSISSFFPLKFLFNSFNIDFYNSFFFSFIKLYLFPILLFFFFFIFFYFFYTYHLLSSNFFIYENKSIFLQYIVNYIFNSFLFNHLPLILIINILLLGLIGAVFLLI